jgi:CRISPR-associated protein Cas1
VVCDIIETENDYDELNIVIKKELLSIPALDVVIDGNKSPLLVAMSRTTNSLQECYAGISRKLLYPKL